MSRLRIQYAKFSCKVHAPNAPLPLDIRYTPVPYGTQVGSAIRGTFTIWGDPLDLPKTPGLVAFVDEFALRVIFVTEYGEGLDGFSASLRDGDAYRLALKFPAFRTHVRQWVTKFNTIVAWAKEWPEDRHLMRQLVTESFPAYEWAAEWPEDRHLMRPFVTEPEWVQRWNRNFPDDQIPLPS